MNRPAAFVWFVALGCSNARSPSAPAPSPASSAATPMKQGRSSAASPALRAAGVRWVGRVDVSDRAAIKLAWSGSGFVGIFSGDAVTVSLRTQGRGPIYFQPVVDGAPGPRFAVGEALQSVDLATGLPPGPHRIELYRESEGKGLGYSVFSGFPRGTPLEPPPPSGRALEIVGDSISAGFGNLGREHHPGYAPDPEGCEFSTATESAYLTYGALAARAVGAELSVLAGSGWGVYSDREGNRARVMPALFGNTLGEQPAPAWNFALEPQAVVINLGTNDAAAHNLTPDKFEPAYAAFVATVRTKYPSAFILCAVGSMLYGADRQAALEQLRRVAAGRARLGDSRVRVLDLGVQDPLIGTGCSWHPSVAEHERMAKILVAELRSSLDW